MRSRPRASSHPAAASRSCSRTTGSSSNSRKPNMPHALPWAALNAWSTWALMRPTTRPARRARNSRASPCLKNAFWRRLRNACRSIRSGGTHWGEVEWSRKGSSMNSRRSARDRTGLTSTDTARPYMAGTQIDVFAKVRGHERAEQLRAAREADVLPYFRVLEGPARPVVDMEGAERIMLGSNNYLGLTGDERVIAGARDALDRYG